jgi:hypothetical protein
MYRSHDKIHDLCPICSVGCISHRKRLVLQSVTARELGSECQPPELRWVNHLIRGDPYDVTWLTLIRHQKERDGKVPYF